MNAVELLMLEHASLRLHFRLIKEGDSDFIYELDDFIRNCHSRIEDEILFPDIRASLRGDDHPQKVLIRFEHDHELISELGEQVRVATVQEVDETLRKKIMLYVDTVETHNADEEHLIFPSWKRSNKEDLTKRIRKTIEVFGTDRYFRTTGISKELLDILV